MSDSILHDAEPEHWHSVVMTVSWTDSGKVFLQHELKDGGRISHPIEIDPAQAAVMTKWKDQ